MMVLAFADVNSSADERVARGVDELECCCCSGLEVARSRGVLLGEQGGESAWYSSLYETGLL